VWLSYPLLLIIQESINEKYQWGLPKFTNGFAYLLFNRF
jgi:hypothetical protein